MRLIHERRRMVLVVGALAAITFAVVGCATLTPQERAGVRMTRDNNIVKDCKWLGQVETSWEANVKRAEIQLMKKTFALGGNIVFIPPQHPSFTIRLTGDAYVCQNLPGVGR